LNPHAWVMRTNWVLMRSSIGSCPGCDLPHLHDRLWSTRLDSISLTVTTQQVGRAVYTDPVDSPRHTRPTLCIKNAQMLGWPAPGASGSSEKAKRSTGPKASPQVRLPIVARYGKQPGGDSLLRNTRFVGE
jgi:hypothetical protein